jgi:hypothetical protein
VVWSDEGAIPWKISAEKPHRLAAIETTLLKRKTLALGWTAALSPGATRDYKDQLLRQTIGSLLLDSHMESPEDQRRGSSIGLIIDMIMRK